MRLYLLFLVVLVAGGCAATQPDAEHATPKQAPAAETKAALLQPVDVQGDDYFVYENAGRIYVLGQEKTSRFFAEHKHIPYARTQIGTGPRGETLVFEIDKKNPELTERLIQTFAARPFPVQHEKGLYVYKHLGRFYVLGSRESAGKFVAHGSIPYARTLIGAGPNGETIVYEIDKKDPKLAECLEASFRG